MVVTLGRQYNIGERPTVVHCTLTSIAMPDHQTQQKQKTKRYIIQKVVTIYDNNAIEPYNNKYLGQQ